MSVSVLVLGQGFVGGYVSQLCAQRGIAAAATSRSGRAGTLPFVFDPQSSDPAPFAALPAAGTVLVTFPVLGAAAMQTLMGLYTQTHPPAAPQFVLLGSTRAWDPALGAAAPGVWLDRHARIDVAADPRLQAEQAVLDARGAVVNLSGLWGGARDPRAWVVRVAPSRDALAGKGSLHLIHGIDAARIVLALHESFTPGERWIATDLAVYDWWELAAAWSASLSPDTGADAIREPAIWVADLMRDRGVRGLPRPVSELGRALDSRETWRALGLHAPVRTLKTLPALL
ncbi:hypothetical protein HK105_207136 [Polyrhizophydium stewartii]|uniref:Ketopantoate reductase n=1 Tax=Polyrhizophydium stewartii TaxID=2732419 RepID=A0ABR4N1J6_9FUNG|nr:hypothetical protein HK105_006456 [Polyrhizophydium stewartii]